MFSEARQELDVILGLVACLEARPVLALKHAPVDAQSTSARAAALRDMRLQQGRLKLQLTDAAARLRCTAAHSSCSMAPLLRPACDLGPYLRASSLSSELCSELRAQNCSMTPRSRRRGASAMRSFAAKDRRFYDDLSALQRCWKLQLAPPGEPYAFQVDAWPGPLVASAFGSRRAATVPPVTAPVPVLSDRQGALRVQVEMPAEGHPSLLQPLPRPKPHIYVGAAQVRAAVAHTSQLLVGNLVNNSCMEV